MASAGGPACAAASAAAAAAAAGAAAAATTEADDVGPADVIDALAVSMAAEDSSVEIGRLLAAEDTPADSDEEDASESSLSPMRKAPS